MNIYIYIYIDVHYHLRRRRLPVVSRPVVAALIKKTRKDTGAWVSWEEDRRTTHTHTQDPHNTQTHTDTRLTRGNKERHKCLRKLERISQVHTHTHKHTQSHTRHTHTHTTHTQKHPHNRLTHTHRG